MSSNLKATKSGLKVTGYEISGQGEEGYDFGYKLADLFHENGIAGHYVPWTREIKATKLAAFFVNAVEIEVVERILAEASQQEGGNKKFVVNLTLEV